MKLSTFAYFTWFGVKSVLSRRSRPVLGTVILTDKCNLHCRHCSVNNITAIMHSYRQIRNEMRTLYTLGCRILFFCGGETFLWEDGGRNIRDLVIEARRMGFLIVNAVTNGTLGVDLPEADIVLLSLDGDREKHNLIRGDTYDVIMDNIHRAAADNIVLYMAVNKLNFRTVRDVIAVAEKEKNVRAVSFNFHTPYPDTADLTLTVEEKAECCRVIGDAIDSGAPVFNLKSALPYLIDNSFPTPCRQCLVIENGKISTCGRCIDIPGLCEKCGYFFVAEYTLLFSGNLRIIRDMLKTYLRYL